MPTDVLHHQYHIFRCVNHFIQPYNVKVRHFFQEFDFSFDTFPAVRVHQLILFVNFEGDFLVQSFVEANTHDSVGSLPYLLPYDVIV